MSARDGYEFNPPAGHKIEVGPHAGKTAASIRPREDEGRRKPTFFHAENEHRARTAAVKVAAADAPEPISPQAVNASAFGGATAPIIGSDVENLPGAPNNGPVKTTTAPSSGKKGPTLQKQGPTAKEVANSIVTMLQGRRGKVPRSPVVDRNKQTDLGPRSNNPEDAEPMQPKNNGSDFSNNMDRSKVAEVLLAIAAPSKFVAEDSILWQASIAKIASVTQAPTDTNLASYLIRDDVHPYALHTMISSKYGDEWIDWDSEVIRETLRQDFGADPSDINMNKIAALQICWRDPDRFANDWHAFEKICLAFDGQAPKLTLVEDLSPEQMAMGVGCVRMLKSASDSEFAPDLKKYCAARLFDAGFVVAPIELAFADDELKKLASNDDLRKRSMEIYTKALAGKEDRNVDQENPPDDFVQAARMMRVHAYALDKLDDVIRQVQ